MTCSFFGIGRFLIALLGTSAVISAVTYREQVALSILLSFLALARFGLSRSNYDRCGAATLGFLLPTIPWVGSQVLLAYGLWFFAARPAVLGEPASAAKSAAKAAGVAGILWLAPFGGYLAGSVIGEVWELLGGGGFRVSSESGMLFSQVRIDGVMRGIDVARALFDVHAPSLAICTRVSLAALAVSFFTAVPEAAECFAKWLIRGVTVAAVYVIAQWLGLTPVILPNQTALWDALGRPSGLMSDPNACGVVLALSLWVALLTQDAKKFLSSRVLSWILLVVVAGVVSGSRTFLLSSTLLAAALVWRSGRRELFWGVLLCAVGAVGITTAIDASSGLIQQIASLDSVPAGLRRGVAALSLLRVEETVMSRSIFLQFAQAIGRGHWFFGVGADRFIDYVPVIGAKLNLVRGWSDNANNFYLGLAVELGIIGVVFFVISLLGRRTRSRSESSHAVACLVMMALIGCTGPHTDFIEVLLVVSLLVAITTEQRRSLGLAYLSCAWIAVVLGFMASTLREQGVYGWSNSSSGASRWLSNRAKVELTCETEAAFLGQSRLFIKPNYIPQTEPLKLSIIVAGQEPVNLSLSVNDPREIAFPCGEGRESIFALITTHPAWSPYRAWPRASNDRRILGIEQLLNP